MPDSELPPDWNEVIRRITNYQLPPSVRDAVDKARSFRLTPEVADTIAAINEQTRNTLLETQRVFASNVVPSLDRWRLQLPKAQEWFRRYGPMLAQIAENARAIWINALPPNWSDLSFEEVRTVIDRVRDSGYSLVWLPRTEIIREALAAEPSGLSAVLLRRRDDILDDAVACLAEAEDRDLALMCEALLESIAALRDGHPRAAQALASSVFTSEIHSLFEMGTKAIRKRMAEEDPEDATIGELRLRTIFLAGARALSEYRPDRAWPIRRDFNRHNTAHRITVEQWTEANALSAIMLAVSLLREMDYWCITDHGSVELESNGA